MRGEALVITREGGASCEILLSTACLQGDLPPWRSCLRASQWHPTGSYIDDAGSGPGGEPDVAGEGQTGRAGGVQDTGEAAPVVAPSGSRRPLAGDSRPRLRSASSHTRRPSRRTRRRSPLHVTSRPSHEASQTAVVPRSFTGTIHRWRGVSRSPSRRITTRSVANRIPIAARKTVQPRSEPAVATSVAVPQRTVCVMIEQNQPIGRHTRYVRAQRTWWRHTSPSVV